MKACLGLIVRNEMGMLPKTIPAYASAFEHRIALDTGSIDGSGNWLSENGFKVTNGEWNGDFSAARNELLRLAEGDGYDWCVMLDADEAMFPDQVPLLLDFLGRTRKIVVYLPRVNVAGNYDRWWRGNDSDPQGRGIRLRSGVKFRNKVHEVPTVPGYQHAAFGSDQATLAHQAIYHYGLCKPAEDIWRRTWEYRMIQSGEKIDLPPCPGADFSHLPKFEQPHPLQHA